MLSSGFLYYVSVTGITGERNSLPNDIRDNIAWLKEHTQLPICVGFGIAKPEHVKMLAPVADGLIVGSAIVRLMEQAADDRNEVAQKIETLVERLMSATSG